MGIMSLNSPGGSTVQWAVGEVCCVYQHSLIVVSS